MIERYMTLAEAAEQLNVSDKAVQKSIERGNLNAERIGNRWVLHIDEVNRWQRVRGGPGRPLTQGAAWEAIRTTVIPSDSNARDAFRRWVRPRAKHVDGYAHQSIVDDLRNDFDIVLSGRDAADELDMPAGATIGQIQLYLMLSKYNDLIERRRVQVPTVRANLCMHVVNDDQWPFAARQRYTDAIVTWLDLADSDDRAESLARDYLIRLQRA
ncbi:MAG: helix-turn-helix domain-containing protein [Actinomycetota bacterium]